MENLLECFLGCTALKTVTLKCAYPEEENEEKTFKDAFKDCNSLEVGGIKVPNDKLEDYKTHASNMGLTDDTKFAAAP